jgi:hypothetical protein
VLFDFNQISEENPHIIIVLLHRHLPEIDSSELKLADELQKPTFLVVAERKL